MLKLIKELKGENLELKSGNQLLMKENLGLKQAWEQVQRFNSQQVSDLLSKCDSANQKMKARYQAQVERIRGDIVSHRASYECVAKKLALQKEKNRALHEQITQLRQKYQSLCQRGISSNRARRDPPRNLKDISNQLGKNPVEIYSHRDLENKGRGTHQLHPDEAKFE